MNVLNHAAVPFATGMIPGRDCDMYSNVLYGVLKYYDLKDLIKKAGIPITYKD